MMLPAQNLQRTTARAFRAVDAISHALELPSLTTSQHVAARGTAAPLERPQSLGRLRRRTPQ